jgi:polyhydroxyalkanoate synthesis repressor PhaR
MGKIMAANEPPVLIKKYANRRLYNTQTSCYVTLEDLCEMVRRHEDFEVRDAKTNDDLTQLTLAQIILEQEGKGSGLLPINFMRELIRSYGSAMPQALPAWLESSMQAFLKHQETIQTQWQEMANKWSDLSPSKLFDAPAAQNTTQNPLQWWQDGLSYWQNLAEKAYKPKD